MPANFKKAYIAIASVLFSGFIYVVTIPHIPMVLLPYFQILFLVISLIGAGYFLRIWSIEYFGTYKRINQLEEKMKKSRKEISEINFGYEIPVFRTKLFFKYRLWIIVAAIAYSIVSVPLSGAGIESLLIQIPFLILFIAYFLLWKFRFSIDSKNIYLSYKTMLGGRNYSLIPISQIKKYLIEVQIRDDLSGLLIRTKRPPYGERPFNPFVQYILTPAIYNDPNILILTRSKDDAEAILSMLGLEE